MNNLISLQDNGVSVSVKYGTLLFLKADREAYTGVTAKWLHTKDPKPQKQKSEAKTQAEKESSACCNIRKPSKHWHRSKRKRA